MASEERGGPGSNPARQEHQHRRLRDPHGGGPGPELQLQQRVVPAEAGGGAHRVLPEQVHR